MSIFFIFLNGLLFFATMQTLRKPEPETTFRKCISDRKKSPLAIEIVFLLCFRVLPANNFKIRVPRSSSFSSSSPPPSRCDWGWKLTDCQRSLSWWQTRSQASSQRPAEKQEDNSCKIHLPSSSSSSHLAHYVWMAEGRNIYVRVHSYKYYKFCKSWNSRKRQWERV